MTPPYRTQDLSDDHSQYFIYQTLRGLKALHSAAYVSRSHDAMVDCNILRLRIGVNVQGPASRLETFQPAPQLKLRPQGPSASSPVQKSALIQISDGASSGQICDFGLARSAFMGEQEATGFLTEYVATRWYRAPEIMLTFVAPHRL